MKNILSLRLKNFLIVALLATLSAPFASANTCIDLLSGNRGILPGLALPNNPVTTDLYFTSKFDQVEEHTLREGKVAAHLYIDTTKRPYFFFAFPAGNTGIGLWFNEAQKSLTLTASAKPRALAFANKMWGVEVDLRGTSKTLNLSDSVLGSMRFVRDRELDVPIPTEVQTRDVTVSGNSIIMKQTAINGMVHYVLEIQVLGDTRIIQSKGKVRLSSPTEIQFTARASTDEKPLTPTPPQELFKKSALEKMSQEEMDAISFLFYKEKLAAGSPRYLTNFGRDRMVTLRVLMDILTPEAAESILSAMLGGSHPTKGWMSHEQHEADFASFVRRRAHKKYKNINDPIEDRSMVDDDFLFTIVFGEYAKRYPERLQEFLNGKDYRGLLLKQLVLNNFQYVAKATEKFTTDPNVKNLIRLKKGHKTGQWRDSEMGLGGGVYPFDVNAAIVPGALKTLTEFYANSENPLRDPSLARFYAHSFEVWNSKVLPLFEVRVAATDLAAYGSRYFVNSGIDPQYLPPTPQEDIVFPAISLNDQGVPVPIMHSDDTMMMAFGYPPARYLRYAAQRIRLPFPYGLNAQIGMLVANPVFATPELQAAFTHEKYHGRVSWLMQEQLWIFGSQRQKARTDLSQDSRSLVQSAQQEVRRMIQVKSTMGSQEVFAIVFENGAFVAKPFAGDAKSNSNQLWSHLRLGIN